MFHRTLALLGVLTALAPAPARPGEQPLPAHLQAGLEAMEYEIRATEHGLQAPNRAQDLRTWFGDHGVDIVPRTRDAQWTWTWRTAEWGRAGAMKAPAVSARHVDGNRVEYRGADGLTEWYVNRPDGLEQGFTLAERPAGDGAIVIAAGMPGGLRAVAAGVTDAIDFLDDHGDAALRYGGLHAWDAAGRALPSRLEWDEARIRIVVEDDGAAYPVTIDPVATSPSWTRRGGFADAYFGWSVATAGDVNADGYSDLIVGAREWDAGANQSGAVFVYLGSATGLPSSGVAWTQVGATLNGYFGTQVACAGDVNNDGYDDVIVGEPGYATPSLGAGRALVYHGNGNGLSLTPNWTFQWNESGANAGHSVAWAGDLNADGYDDVIVGIPFDDRSRLPDAGMAQIFHGSASGLSPSPAIILLGAEANDYFGYSVATAGDVNADGYADVLIGAYNADSPSLNNTGTAQIWYGSASGVTGFAAWTAYGENTSAVFGQSVAPAGDVDGDGYADVIVGAYGQSSFLGKVYVYRGSASGPSTTPYWTAVGDPPGDFAGWAVGTAGDLDGDGFADFAYGSTAHSSGKGRMDYYLGDPLLGPYADFLTTRLGTYPGGSYGFSVGTAGDVNGDGFSDLACAAPLATVSLTEEGIVHVFHGGAASDHATGFVHSGTGGNRLGVAVAGGDWNGDGFPDLAAAENGAVSAWLGSAGGPPDPSTSAAWTATGSAAAMFGAAIANAGDVNGDGRDDLIVGAYLDGGGQEGSFSVYHGSAGGLSASAATYYLDPAGDWLGFAVAGAGDLNDDGFADVIVGAPRADLPSNNEGAAKIFLGSASGIDLGSVITLEGNRTAAGFGTSVAGGGDVDGDGHADIIVGAPSFENQSGVFGGRAFVYRGTSLGVSTSSYWQGFSSGSGDDYGQSVDCRGDVNGDGLADLAVGCPGFDYVTSGNEGAVFVHLAQPGGGFGPATEINGNSYSTVRFGEKVAFVGDSNSDGCSDLLVGAPDWNVGNSTNAGRTLIFTGGAAGISTVSPGGPIGTQTDQRFGRVIAPAGDANGDGYADYYIGSPDWDGTGTDDGRVLLQLGASAFGATRRVDLRQLDSVGDPIPLQTNADLTDRFRIALNGFSAAGRVPLRLEVHVTELATGIVHADLGPWTDPGAPVPGVGCVAAFDWLQAGLPAGASFSWRVRVRARSPLFPHGPWFSLAPAAGLEAVRTPDQAAPTDAPAIAAAENGGFRVWPNPFREGITAAIRTTAAGPLRVEVIDVAGRRIATIADGDAPAGFHECAWDGLDAAGSRVAAGVYLLRVTADERTASRKVIRLD
ncbi:MAG TPA: FG-GAP-like repeat-containing protein [bacterium]|nr:FG-GAP-like repeat-containing protein [bacterium]